MKGFPNQIADLSKVTRAIRALGDLLRRGQDPKDDWAFGEALVRAHVAGTGHKPIPIEKYLAQQRKLPLGRQSPRATARGIRELFRDLGIIEETDNTVRLTPLGEVASRFRNDELDPEKTEFWRKVVRSCENSDGGSVSYPYQALLHLVAQCPGITRAKCALALEAKDNSPQELARIVALSKLPEDEIVARIGVTKANWDNAKKVLPKFAEQLGDVVRKGRSLYLSNAPGSGTTQSEPAATKAKRGHTRSTAAVRTGRDATPETIARVTNVDDFDEGGVSPEIDPASQQEAARRRLERLRRHNNVVAQIARRLAEHGCQLKADPYDALATFRDCAVLIEVKSLDGSPADEQDRVREAMAQLLYYEAFAATAAVDGIEVQLVACFESQISREHQDWLARQGIATIWLTAANQFAGNALAAEVLGDYLPEIR